MLRKWGLLIGGSVIFFIMLSMFFVNRASEDTVLAQKILEQAEKGTTEISLSTLTDFDWEKASVYGPYTTIDVIEESLNVEFKGSINGIDSRDDIFLLVFAKGNHAIKTVELSRKAGDYYEKNGTLTPKNDILIIN
ncbi:hypothetical protein FQ087_03015 [Sporosarcina sp. ANT_H38]|uniref:hypothetical protein n=1 Tax=Sporosarcina sp. ANT_H38 TaxID=2597358 RepID=UPI0011F17410|nr:hypothetical protein [Sporosarcina sp. ANT_H38]KAA0965295.1 hypothetical protein FQ087_03015 [Sporosarcina sp. ANT_H38]